MSIVMHPLTALNGAPSYTADDYRHAVNPLLLPSDGSPFGGLQGIRAGVASPLCSIDGLVVTVRPHCGTVCPWTGIGSYTYAITESVEVNIADSTGDYKIAVVVDDPSQSHGETPQGLLKVFADSVPDSNIPGMVIAEVSAGVISDMAPILRSTTVVEVPTLARLRTVSAVDGQEAVTSSDGNRYRLIDGVWQSLSDIKLNPGQWYKDWSAVDYKCSMVGNIVSLVVKATRGPEWVAKAWSRSQILTFPDYVKPNVTDFNVPAAGVANSGFQLDSTGLYVRPFADITYGQGTWTSATLSWSV